MYLEFNQKKIEIKECKSFFSRLKGFMFMKKKIQNGLWFPRCRSIHTFFMFQNISLIFTDRNFEVIAYYPNVEKNQTIIAPKNVYHTFELPPYFEENIKIGTILKIRKRKK